MRDEPKSPKARAAFAGAALVRNGMIVGLGSGSTSMLMVERLGERVAEEGLEIIAVATSTTTAQAAAQLKIKVRELDDVDSIDINLDGADEIDARYRMIKGRGGALLREKLVVSVSRRRVTMITADKRVDHLGTTMPLPIEVSLVGIKHTERRLRELGATATEIRVDDKGVVYLTDGGNGIIDCHFSAIDNPETLDFQLQTIPGVLETGLFIGMCDYLIVGHDDAVEQIETGLAK